MSILDYLNQNSGAINAIATAILVLITGWYAYITKKILKSGEDTSKEMLRPYIVVNIYSEDLFINLSISNIGKRPAKDLNITFDPSLKMIEKANSENLENDKSYEGFDHEPMLNQKFMPPNHSVNTVLAYNPFFIHNERLPRIYTVTFTYKDLNNISYKEEYTFDLSSYVYKHKSMNHTDNYHFKEISKSLKSIDKKFKKQ